MVWCTYDVLCVCVCLFLRDGQKVSVYCGFSIGNLQLKLWGLISATETSFIGIRILSYNDCSKFFFVIVFNYFSTVYEYVFRRLPQSWQCKVSFSLLVVARAIACMNEFQS